jgi:cell division protein FtsN
LAALGPDYTERYVRKLEGEGIHAAVAPGPSENLYRVVLGPFADQTTLEKQRDVLEAAGIQSMLRVY